MELHDEKKRTAQQLIRTSQKIFELYQFKLEQDNIKKRTTLKILELDQTFSEQAKFCLTDVEDLWI